MKIVKSLMVGFLIVVGTMISVQAKVIDLDNTSAAKCRAQINGAPDAHPVVMVYSSSCPHALEFWPIYRQVVAKFPHRTLFAYDFSDESDDQVFANCIMRDEEVSPDSIVMKKVGKSYHVMRQREGVISLGVLTRLITVK